MNTLYSRNKIGNYTFFSRMPRSLGDLPNEIFQLIYEVQVGIKMMFTYSSYDYGLTMNMYNEEKAKPIFHLPK